MRQQHAYAGRHNQQMEASTSRIVQGGSWKKQRIIRLKPAGKLIPSKVAETHEVLLYPPNQPVHRMLTIDLEVGEAYSTTIEAILQHPILSTWEYLLTIEHDNMPPQDGVLKLLEAMEQHKEFACIGGLYWTKGEGGVPQIWGDPRDPAGDNFRPQPPEAGKIKECCGTGMGFNLWRLSMFKDPKLRRPWFKTQTEGGVATQDLYFWGDARKHGYRCAVDCRVLVGHYDVESDTVW